MQLWSGRNTHNLDLSAGTVSQNGLHAVWKITSEAIDELHRSLESCPEETAMAEDPAGLKVSWEGPQGRVSWIMP